MKKIKAKKVFFQNLSFQFDKKNNATSIKHYKHYSSLLKKALLEKKLAKFILTCITQNSKTIYIKKSLYKPFLRNLKNHTTYIKAAGGIVINNKKEIVFIHRLGKWDLPKGKIEEGEKKDMAAIREVQEETGLKNITIKKKFCNTYHLYYVNNNLNLKKVYWYIVECNKKNTFSPQIQEGITDVIWLKHKKITKVFKNTFPLIKDLIKNFIFS